MNNILSFDVEDYYHLLYRNWLGIDVEPSSRDVVVCTERILDLLDKFGCTATFFVVGRVAERFPKLVERIASSGHEVGSHGYDHVYVKQLSPEAFRDDLAKSKDVIEEISGVSVIGFRAPEFSIDRSTPWAFEILAELGFRYDSSLFPCSGTRYGDSRVPLVPHEIDTKYGSILEIPLSTISFAKRRIPAAGGGYIRFFPVSFNSWAIRKMNEENRRAVVYLHPHEFQPNPDPIHYGNVGMQQKLKAVLFHRKQLVGRRHCLSKLRCLLERHRFSSFEAEFGFQDAAERNNRSGKKSAVESSKEANKV